MTTPTTRKLRRICRLFPALALLTSAGCGTPHDQPELALVAGTVMLDGQPLAGIHVSFQPEMGRGSLGLTDEAGRYRLQYTFDTPGAKLGPHVVSLTTPRGDDSDPHSQAVRERVPTQFNEHTTLAADVQPGSNEINFDLTSH